VSFQVSSWQRLDCCNFLATVKILTWGGGGASPCQQEAVDEVMKLNNVLAIVKILTWGGGGPSPCQQKDLDEMM
jgi:hypothetical protein